MDLYSVFIVSFAVAFVVSVVDYFVDLGIWRAAMSVALSAVGVVALELNWQQTALCALASAFLSMTALTLIERTNIRPGRIR